MEQLRLSRGARLYGMDCLVCFGWAEKVLVFVSGFDVQVSGNVVVCVENKEWLRFYDCHRLLLILIKLLMIMMKKLIVGYFNTC